MVVCPSSLLHPADLWSGGKSPALRLLDEPSPAPPLSYRAITLAQRGGLLEGQNSLEAYKAANSGGRMSIPVLNRHYHRRSRMCIS